ncbi:MAG: hypothetical protein Q9169_002841 [Polycauliona sp. 2 TL-2023]
MSIQGHQSKAFHLGGQKDPFSDASCFAQDNPKPYFVQGLLAFEERDESFRNLSSAGLNQAGTLLMGFVSFVGPIGSQGTLVAFGGLTANAAESVPVERLDSPELRWQMEYISVYDIANQQWYQQQASGDIPPWRRAGCAIAVSAMDNSSHSVYVFGGWGRGQNNDGNVYVLSIPSFTWIRVTLDTDQRSHHQCHLMGKHHMLVVGGIRSDGNEHATGGATKRTPSNGFSSDPLRSLLNVSESDSNTAKEDAHDPTKSEPLGVAAIAGIAAGSSSGALLLAAIVWYMIRRRRQNHRQVPQGDGVVHWKARNDTPCPLWEIGAATVGSELNSGVTEERLARMYQSNELPNSSEIHEISHIQGASELPASHELSTLLNGRELKIPLPYTSHPALEKNKRF